MEWPKRKKDFFAEADLSKIGSSRKGSRGRISPERTLERTKVLEAARKCGALREEAA